MISADTFLLHDRGRLHKIMRRLLSQAEAGNVDAQRRQRRGTGLVTIFKAEDIGRFMYKGTKQTGRCGK